MPRPAIRHPPAAVVVVHGRTAKSPDGRRQKASRRSARGISRYRLSRTATSAVLAGGRLLTRIMRSYRTPGDHIVDTQEKNWACWQCPPVIFGAGRHHGAGPMGCGPGTEFRWENDADKDKPGRHAAGDVDPRDDQIHPRGGRTRVQHRAPVPRQQVSGVGAVLGASLRRRPQLGDRIHGPPRRLQGHRDCRPV